MTRRERLEQKAERRREWADGRRAKAARDFSRGDAYRGDVAFNTQPGHIPERARVIAAAERGARHLDMASHHESKAAGLESQLERSIFSDDADAIERLRERIAEHEAAREHHTAVNRAFRKAPGADSAAKLVHLLNAGTITPAEARDIARDMGACPWQRQPFAPYVNANLGNRIKADRDRIAAIEERQKLAAQVEAAPAGLVVMRHAEINWCRVAFAEKPAREILDALKAAGYRWTSGYWCGYLDKLPACVAELEAQQ